MIHGFALSRDAGCLPRSDHQLADWHLAVADHLPVTPLRDLEGTQVGVLIGWAISSDADFLAGGELVLPVTAGGMDDLHRAHIRPLAGTYLAILSVQGDTRLYLDGLANLTAVFDAEREMVGGTAADILDEAAYEERFDRDLFDAFEIKREGWFPAGLTAHRGIERLMPNHFLNCEDWSVHRHESYANLAEAEPSAALQVIAEQIGNCIKAPIDAGHEVVIGLTGGADSRLLLAGVRAETDKVHFYTVAPPERGGSSFDLVRATELVEMYGLRHQTLPYRTATPEQQELWDRRVSHSVITNNRLQHPSVYPLDDAICIGGLGGEVGRCFLWKRLDDLPPITATGLIDALKLPRVPELVSRIESWLDQLPVTEPTRILDLAYIELRMGTWNSAQAYANPRSTIIHPLASFASIEAMLSLPPAYRQDDGLIAGFIRHYWPELLDLPINLYGDYRDTVALARKIANPTKLFRKARQIVRTRS